MTPDDYASLWLLTSRSVIGNLPSDLRTVETQSVSDVTQRVRCERMGGHKKNGPGGCVNTRNPGPEPPINRASPREPEVSLEQAWTDEVRRAAIVAVRVAAARREAGRRTLAYYIRAAHAHGLSEAEITLASGLARDEVHDLLDPAVA